MEEVAFSDIAVHESFTYLVHVVAYQKKSTALCRIDLYHYIRLILKKVIPPPPSGLRTFCASFHYNISRRFVTL